jgi:hypothetical protein
MNKCVQITIVYRRYLSMVADIHYNAIWYVAIIDIYWTLSDCDKKKEFVKTMSSLVSL